MIVNPKHQLPRYESKAQTPNNSADMDNGVEEIDEKITDGVVTMFCLFLFFCFVLLLFLLLL